MTAQGDSKGVVSPSCRTRLSQSTCSTNDLVLRLSRSRCPHLSSPALSSRSSPPSAFAPVLPTEPGLLPSPSIILVPKVKLSNNGIEPYEEDGDGSGWELRIEIDSGRRVWFRPRPFDSGTPTSLVGGVEVGMQDSTGYGDHMCAPRDSYLYESRHNIRAAQQHLLRDPSNQRHGPLLF